MVSEQSARQDSLMTILAENLTVLQDTLQMQSGVVVDTRGGLTRQIREVQDEIVRMTQVLVQVQRSIAALESRMELLQELEQRPVIPTTRPRDMDSLIVAPGGTGPDDTQAEDAWNAGVEQFNRGQLGTARLAFQRFVEMYPDHRLAPRGLLLLGDILEQEENLEDALAGFLRVAELYPTSDQVPRAYYRVGLIYVRLDDSEQARDYFQRVVNTYPETSAATLAQEELAKLAGGVQ